MKYKAIIFDMDGTIIATHVIWETLIDRHINHLSDEKKEEIISSLKGRTSQEICTVLAQYSPHTNKFEDIIEEKKSVTDKLYELNKITFVPFFADFHKKVQEKGLKTAIATNATSKSIEKITRYIPLRNFFLHHIYHIDMVHKMGKPNPDIYLHAAQEIGVQPQECIAIEDSAPGIKAARAAGMYCIGINTGKNKQDLAHAHEIVDCYTEIDLEKILQSHTT